MTDQTAYLNLVLEKLKERIAKLNLSLEEGAKEVEDMHEYYWENYTEMDQYGYEDYDNQQALLNQLNTNQQQMHLKHRFQKMLDSPFFGRVDFCYDGEDAAESFYIGIGNFAERTGQTPLVYDWRAPVSGLFYDFDKGEAWYEAPGGRMDGEIVSKWQYKIKNGKMVYAFESDVKIDDDILKAELGANGDVQLKNIVRTIQKEQNAIIRNTSDRILVIQGVAGSGKTSVALHRIAYLLYHDRKNLKSSNILILSPNGVFSDYISHILPELGEENIQEMSFDLFAYRELKDVVPDCEDRYDMIERNLVQPKERGRYWEKQSPDFLNQMEGYLMELEDSLMDIRDFTYRNYEIKASRILLLFYTRFLEIPLLSRMDAVREYVVNDYETLAGRDLNEEEQQYFYEQFMAMYETRDIYVLYSRFLESVGMRPLPSVWYEKRMLRYEDVYPVLYLKYRLLQPAKRAGVKHLVIDEMQDYTPMQYQILSQLFPCKMTILGDRAQTMDEKQQDVLTFLPGILGKKLRKIVMDKSYRNTVEIAAYAAELAGITDLKLFERHGKPVCEKKITEKEVITQILKELRVQPDGYETAAVLTITDQEAWEMAAILKKELGDEQVTYMNKDSSRFKKGITVTTFYLAKGLEFDQVFTVWGRQPEDDLIRQAKYICATRALHELYMYQVVTEKSRDNRE